MFVDCCKHTSFVWCVCCKVSVECYTRQDTPAGDTAAAAAAAVVDAMRADADAAVGDVLVATGVDGRWCCCC